jgi:hypothetical protein
MTCTRCEGLMVSDNLIDIQESSQSMWMRGWRHFIPRRHPEVVVVLPRRVPEKAGGWRSEFNR